MPAATTQQASVSIEDEAFEAEQRLDLLQKMAHLCEEVETLEDSVTLLQQLLLIEPGNLDARSLLRNIQIDLHEQDSALNKPIQALKVQTLLSQAVSTESLKERLGVVEKALTLNPFHMKANMLLASSAREMNLHRVAAFGYETMLQRQPHDMRLLQPLAKLYEEMGDHKSACSVLEDILDQDPDDVDASELLITARKHVQAAEKEKAGGVKSDAEPAPLDGEDAEEVIAKLRAQLSEVQEMLKPLLGQIETAGGATPEQKAELQHTTRHIQQLHLAMLKEEARMEPDDMELQWILGEKRYETGHYATAYTNFETTSHDQDFRHDSFIRMGHCLVQKAYQEAYYSQQ